MLFAFDRKRYRWTRISKTSGDGNNECFEECGKYHKHNSTSKDQMRMHHLYCEYPKEGFSNLGAEEGIFDNGVMYLGLPTKGNIEAVRSVGAGDSLYVWGKKVND